MERALAAIVGRDDELDLLVRSIADDRPVAVMGEAGIGKTSLVRAAAHASTRRLFEGGGFATLSARPMLAMSRAVGRSIGGEPAYAAAAVERLVGPDVLFIDDLHWVDTRSLATLEMLVGRVSIVTAIRDTDPDADLAIGFVTRNGFHPVRLDGVGPEAAREIARRAAPGLRPSEVADIVRSASGNPLILEEMASHGAISPVLARLISAGLERLDPDARATIDLMAVLDRPVDDRELGVDVGPLLRAGLIVDRDHLAQIRHPMLAETIRASIDPSAVAAIHRRAATLGDDPIASARHQALAGDLAAAVATADSAIGRTDDRAVRAALLSIIGEAAPALDPRPRLVAAQALRDVADWHAIIRIVSVDDDGWPPDARSSGAAFAARALFETAATPRRGLPSIARCTNLPTSMARSERRSPSRWRRSWSTSMVA
jgi:hypothetical protein